MPSSDLKARMYFDQGRQSFAQQHFDVASDSFRSAIDTDPQFHEAHRYLAESFEKLGYKHRAKKAWEALLRISSDVATKEEVQKRISAL